MSAEVQGAPCELCHALGFLPKYGLSTASIEICHECNGEKYIKSASADRAILGVCLYCKQEINLSGAPPCLPDYPAHVILSDLPKMVVKSE